MPRKEAVEEVIRHIEDTINKLIGNGRKVHETAVTRNRQNITESQSNKRGSVRSSLSQEYENAGSLNSSAVRRHEELHTPLGSQTSLRSEPSCAATAQTVNTTAEQQEAAKCSKEEKVEKRCQRSSQRKEVEKQCEMNEVKQQCQRNSSARKEVTEKKSSLCKKKKEETNDAVVPLCDCDSAGEGKCRRCRVSRHIVTHSTTVTSVIECEDEPEESKEEMVEESEETVEKTSTEEKKRAEAVTPLISDDIRTDDYSKDLNDAKKRIEDEIEQIRKTEIAKIRQLYSEKAQRECDAIHGDCEGKAREQRNLLKKQWHAREQKKLDDVDRRLDEARKMLEKEADDEKRRIGEETIKGLNEEWKNLKRELENEQAARLGNSNKALEQEQVERIEQIERELKAVLDDKVKAEDAILNGRAKDRKKEKLADRERRREEEERERLRKAREVREEEQVVNKRKKEKKVEQQHRGRRQSRCCRPRPQPCHHTFVTTVESSMALCHGARNTGCHRSCGMSCRRQFDHHARGESVHHAHGHSHGHHAHAQHHAHGHAHHHSAHHNAHQSACCCAAMRVRGCSRRQMRCGGRSVSRVSSCRRRRSCTAERQCTKKTAVQKNESKSEMILRRQKEAQKTQKKSIRYAPNEEPLEI